jgi:hypothetical protein
MRHRQVREAANTMIETLSKGLTQKPALIKGPPPVTPSRVFALWLALLMLYFLILPTAAETTEGGVQTSAGANQTLNTTVGVARR